MELTTTATTALIHDDDDGVVDSNNNKKNSNNNKNNILSTTSALFPSDPLWWKHSKKILSHDDTNTKENHNTMVWYSSSGESTIRKRTNCLHPHIIFYSSWYCPYSQIIWILLEHIQKQIKYQWKEINTYEVDMNEPGGYTRIQQSLQVMEHLYSDFIRRVSPKGLVPAIHIPKYHKYNSSNNNNNINTQIHNSSDKEQHQKESEYHDDDDIKLYNHFDTDYDDVIGMAKYLDKVYNEGVLCCVPLFDPCRDNIMNKWIRFILIIQEKFECIIQHLQSINENEKNDNTTTTDTKKLTFFVQEFYEDCIILQDGMSMSNDVDIGQEGPYFFGPQITLLDFILVPFYQRFIWIGNEYENQFISCIQKTNDAQEEEKHQGTTTSTSSSSSGDGDSDHHYSSLCILHHPKLNRLNQIWWPNMMIHPAVSSTLVCKARLQASYRSRRHSCQ